MTPRILIPKRKEKGLVSLLAIVLIGFIFAFFPRVLLLFGAPSVVTLVHLGLIPAVCLLVLSTTKAYNRVQVTRVRQLLLAVILFFAVNLASAALNQAGLVNALANFLLLCEHFLFLLAIVSLSLSSRQIRQFRRVIYTASFVNILFAYVQRYGLNWHLQTGAQDNIKGVFIEGGAGHVVGASVALTFGVYFFVVAKQYSFLIRSAVLLAAFWQMNISDAKQVLLVFVVAGVLMVLTKFRQVGKAIQYFAIASLVLYVLYWLVYNIPALDGFLTWTRPDIYGSDGEATLLKTAAFRIVPTYYDSLLSPFLGLGPGHTVSRLGGWMLLNYQDLLIPLGATIHPASSEVWSAVADSWLGDQSSLFSPLFGWAGIWGDLGVLGLVSFGYIWWLVWQRFCLDDISKFLVLTVVVFGFIFSQMEEPGYMVYVVSIIGLQWHEHQNKQKRIRVQRNLNQSGLRTAIANRKSLDIPVRVLS